MRNLLLRVPRWMRRPLAILASLALAAAASYAVPEMSFPANFFVGFALGAVLVVPAVALGYLWEQMEADR